MATESQRKAIRYQIAQMLSGIDGVGSNVFPQRAEKTWNGEHPVILVYGRNEPAEIHTAAPRRYERRLLLNVHIQCKGKQLDIDDQMDDIAEVIEQRIFSDETLNGLAVDTVLTDTEIEHDAEGDEIVGVTKILFEVRYQTLAPAETTGLEDFERFGAEFSIPGSSEATAPASEVVDFPAEEEP